MNIAATLSGVILIALGAYGLSQDVAAWYAGAVVGFGALVCATSFRKPTQAPATTPEPTVDTPSVPPASAGLPAARPDGEEAILLLHRLQEKGRFMDFLMDDVSAYSDEQVGAAARVVHQGCSGVITDAFAPGAISEQAEGQSVTLKADYERAAYQLSGQVNGEPPFTGNLVHKGWRATKVKLPKRVGTDAACRVIIPATVELP